jgi:hypothetical protein
MSRRDRSGDADRPDRAVGMEFELSKIDAAVDQIDWAIRLFLDHQAYLPASRSQGRPRNWLKHWDQRTDDEKIRLQLAEEAIQYIVRALTNLAMHDGSQPSEGLRFWNWMDQNRRDLLA